MKNNIFDKRLQIIKLTKTSELYIKIQNFMEKEIDIHFALGDLSIKGDLKIYSTDEKEINVSATYDFPETGEKKTHQFKVIYENDKWLIDSYPLVQYYFSK